MTMHLRAVVPILLSFFLLSCNLFEESDKKAPSTSPVVARANESVLTLDDLDSMIPAEYGQYYRTEDRRALVNRWIETELVYQEAVRQGLDREPELRNKVEEFERLLLENEILHRMLGTRVAVTNEEIEQYYQENPDFFLREKEEVRLSQIVVDSSGLAEDLREKLETDPSLFGAFAAEYSLEESGKNNGDVGFYEVDELIEPLRKVIKTMNVGEISPVVDVPGVGSFIVTVTDRQGPETMKSLEDMADEIKDILLVSKEEEERRKWVEGLISSSDVEIDWQLIEEVSRD